MLSIGLSLWEQWRITRLAEILETLLREENGDPILQENGNFIEIESA